MILVTDGKDKYLVEEKKSFSTKYGEIKEVKLGEMTTQLGKKYYGLEPSFVDKLLKCKRGPAVVLPKDFGIIVAYIGINKDSFCLDSGSGSGWLSAQLAHLCKKVVTYEKRREFYDIAKKNFEFLGLKNITIKNKDVTKGFDEVDADLITLDLLHPEEVPFEKSLKVGGYCVAYVPHIEQAVDFCKSLKNCIVEKIVDIAEDLFDEQGKHRYNEIKHTAYLVFARKVLGR